MTETGQCWVLTCRGCGCLFHFFDEPPSGYQCPACLTSGHFKQVHKQFKVNPNITFTPDYDPVVKHMPELGDCPITEWLGVNEYRVDCDVSKNEAQIEKWKY